MSPIRTDIEGHVYFRTIPYKDLQFNNPVFYICSSLMIDNGSVMVFRFNLIECGVEVVTI